VAIIGAGMIGAVHRRAALLAGAEVAGVLASTPQRSHDIAEKWGVPISFDNIDDLLGADVDVVHICTPNAMHAPYALRAIQAGKHVVCEKPLGLDLDEARAMVEAGAAAGVVTAVPFVYRYHPLVHEIRARRIAGEFGSWNLLHGSYLQDWMLDKAANSWRVDPAVGGASRAFADIGSHWCDLVEWVSGERIASLTAALSTAHAERDVSAAATFERSAPNGLSGGGSRGGTAVAERPTVQVTTEDSAVVSFRTESGVLGSLTVSQVAAGRKNRLWFELDGATGSAVFDQENPETIWLGTELGATVVARGPQHGSAQQRRRDPLPAGHSRGYAQCFEDLVADTYATVDGAQPESLPTFVDGLRSAQLIDTLLRSAATGQWVDVNP
jgi:predicted dehydrogenase